MDGLTDKIRDTYRQAAREIRRKLDRFTAAHRQRSAQMLAQVKAGKLSKGDYQKWLQGQVFVGERWRERLDDITRVYVHADDVARQAVGRTARNEFVRFANQTARDIAHDFGGAVSFDMYDSATVERLLQDNPQMLPEWRIDEPKDYVWNERRVQNAVTQGIIQGEPISDIADRLCTDLATSNAKKMDNFARTAVTGAQNAGRIDRMHQAQEMGIRVRKKWLAAHDDRVRDSHAELDGTVVDVDEDFVTINGNHIAFPGDPSAPPEEVYNCRCTLVYVYPDFEGLLETEGESADVNETHPELKEHEERGYAIASRAYVRNDSHLLHCLDLVKPIDGYDDFGTHGKAHCVEIETNNGVIVAYDAGQFAEILRADPKYNGGDVRLLACDAGKEEDGFASQLAQKLDVNVMAPTGILNISDEFGAREPGDMFVCDIDTVSEMWYNGIDVEEQGGWRVFHPDGTWETVDKKGRPNRA